MTQIDVLIRTMNRINMPTKPTPLHTLIPNLVQQPERSLFVVNMRSTADCLHFFFLIFG
jgi:hypothetical protein